MASAPAAHADKATAQALFDEGRALMAKGDFAHACPKLEESQKQDPGMGTQFRLAECYEGLGKTASAWANYLEVADLAKAAGQPDREKVARDKADKIAQTLSRLTVVAPKIDGLVVKRDGAELGPGQLGTAIPVDPGRHEIDATAPGRRPFHATIEVGKDGAKATATVPELEPEGASGGGSGRRTLGLVVSGVGVLAVGASVFVGFSAKSKWHESDGHCEGNVCDPDGLSFRDAGRDRGNLATILFAGGAVIAATGLVLFFTAPRAEPTSGSAHVPTFAVTKVTFGPGSFLLGGRF